MSAHTTVREEPNSKCLATHTTRRNEPGILLLPHNFHFLGFPIYPLPRRALSHASQSARLDAQSPTREEVRMRTDSHVDSTILESKAGARPQSHAGAPQAGKQST